MRSIDIIVDRAGFEIQWGCLVWVPALYVRVVVTDQQEDRPTLLALLLLRLVLVLVLVLVLEVVGLLLVQVCYQLFASPVPPPMASLSPAGSARLYDSTHLYSYRYTLNTRFMVQHPSGLSLGAALVLFGVSMAGVVLNYLSDLERDTFRANNVRS
jgi:hypothetical protein